MSLMLQGGSSERSFLLSGWRYRAIVASVLLGAIGYVGYAIWSGWHDVAEAAGKVGLAGVVAAVALSLVNFGLRFLRWQAYLQALGQHVPWQASLRIYLAGFALTTTPGKAGEALRGVLLKPWGMPYAKSFAAFLSERLSDLCAVLLLTLFGLSAFPVARPLTGISAALVLAVFAVLSSGALLRRLHEAAGHRSGRFALLLRNAAEVLLHSRQCHEPVLFIGATALSLAAWAAQACTFHLVLHRMGLNLPFAFAVFVYAVAVLAGALSFLPGGLGGTEASMAALLIWKGANPAQAAAAVILIQMTTLWLAVVIGVVALQGRRGDRLPAAK
ncbi:MAG TPA: lysylphosphatidylglycerol synthase transmembrane domain-containing protein [Burkholderiaceae bacterium]|nr:lysylphosphatidylglycerol synthase transmembrane domain-containing protein [Burkholderiaceae bacterium]